jgi:hypothetical protein
MLLREADEAVAVAEEGEADTEEEELLAQCHRRHTARQ